MGSGNRTPGEDIMVKLRVIALVAASFVASPYAWAVEIEGVHNISLDQPRVNAIVSPAGSIQPYVADIFGVQAFNIQAFYDTGASGVLLSNNTASFLFGELTNPGVPLATINNKPLIFEDVGVAGSDRFAVSVPVDFALAPFHPDADQAISDAEGAYPAITDAMIQSIYTQRFTGIKAQVGPYDNELANSNPLLSDLDVFGMPTMKGKVLVMDPTPVNTFMDTMRTYIYNPGTPYNPAAADTNPGIPDTDYKIKLTYASFEQFTDHRLVEDENATPKVYSDILTPEQLGNHGVTLADNPFIGPDPTLKLTGQSDPDTPAVRITRDVTGAGQSTTIAQSEGSWLLDTGASASIISQQQAAGVHVRYVAGTYGTDDRALEYFDPANPGAPGIALTEDEQFALTIGGIGGELPLAGFFLDTLTLPTMDGKDPIIFKHVPVLVGDVTAADPLDPNVSLTLDGIFGMNLLVASIQLSEPVTIDSIFTAPMAPSAFTSIVIDFDDARSYGILGLNVVPEPSSMGLLLLMAGGMSMRRRHSKKG